jgi:hypothetical protein
MHTRILLFVFTLWAGFLTAQPKQNSPYSRFGIGDPVPQYFPVQAAMGGMTAAFHDPYHLNFQNPASFAFLRATAFEGALYGKNSNYQSGEVSQSNWSGNLSYLALGFTLNSPINEVLDRVQSPWQAGMGVSLMPYTLIGYNIEAQDTLPDIGAVTNAFEGRGGAYRLNWSSAIKYKNTAAGINLGWVFGKAVFENTTTFDDSLPTAVFHPRSFRNNFRDQQTFNGFVWRAGLQHDFVLKRLQADRSVPERWLTVGIAGEGSRTIRTVADVIRIRSRDRQPSGNYLTPDTLVFNTGLEQELTLPATLSLGIQYVNSTKFKIGGEYIFTNGSVFNNQVRSGETTRNTHSVSGGLEYTPDYNSYNNYAKRIRYRIGGYYRQDQRVIDGRGLDDLGVTFGLGLPLILPRQQTSFVNAALELGQLGANTTISETYFRISLGFTLNDNSWFYKRRFE